FSNLGTEQFDTIAFNPPYLPTSPSERVAGSLNSALDGGRTGRNVTNRFLRAFSSHLKPRGTLLLVDSSLADYHKSVRFLQSRGFSVNAAGSQRFFFEEIVVLRAQRKQKAQRK
ncbi:MAG: HemK2/MTQ2 family protein methyltransferase, partial [Candidatus Micrarchaeota archaeon]